MRGVINLRGAAVPVVDLRLKFGRSATERTLNTCIITAEVAIGGERDERFVIILDVDRVFSSDELSLVQSVGEAQPAAG